MSVSQSTEYRRPPATVPRVDTEARERTRKAERTSRGVLGPGLAGATHAILRIGAGLLFFHHGAAKLFGWFGGMGPDGGTAPLFSLMGLAGVLEVFGGLAIALGVLTRPVAFVLAVEMLIAYFYAHAPRGWIPLTNGGELALLYGFVWIYFVGNGAGPASLDRLFAARVSVTDGRTGAIAAS